MMKHLYRLLFLIAGAGIFFSCDKIEGPYIAGDESVATTVEFPPVDTATVYRKILMEEFTGTRCTNCPRAHGEMARLSRLFGDTLVCLSIHAGFYAIPQGVFQQDFRTETGNTLFNDFGIEWVPAAVINRDSVPIQPANWQQCIDTVNLTRNIAAIQIINEYDIITKKLTVHTQTTVIADYPSPVKLALYVMEDSITAPQQNGEQIDSTYIHNHVLRGSLNGTYGAYISEDGLIVKGKAYRKSYSKDCNTTNWNAARCSIIAILMDNNSGEVLQVEKRKFLDE